MHEANLALPSAAGFLELASLHTHGVLFQGEHVTSFQSSAWLLSKSTFTSEMAGEKTSQLDSSTVDQ